MKGKYVEINKLLDLLPEPLFEFAWDDYEKGYNDCLGEIIGIIQHFDPEKENNNEIN